MEKVRVTTGKFVAGLIITILVSCAVSAVVCPCAHAASMWNKTFGGAAADTAAGETVQAIDGGYAILGDTSSFGAGGSDFWLIKTDADGNMQWNKTYGGTGNDFGQCIEPTSDGGYAIACITASFGAGSMDIWMVKIDSSGNMQWNQTYGGAGSDGSTHFIQTADGGYAIVGFTTSGSQDAWLVKTDSAGNLQWNMTYGGTGTEISYALLETSDGGYLLTINTNSFGAGGNDIWLVKTDELGVFPEGLTIGAMVLLSTVAVIVGTRYFRKRPRIENYSQVKP